MSDRYTKAMLTVIAVALIGLLARDLVAPLNAQTPPPVQRVVICDARNVDNCAFLVGGRSDAMGNRLYWLPVTEGIK